MHPKFWSETIKLGDHLEDIGELGRQY